MKSRTFGLYVGAMVDPAFNWQEELTRLKSAGYTDISVFLTTAFFNKGMWPWPLNSAGKFDFSQLNIPYREHYRKALLASASTGVRLHLCFVDQFHGFGDNPNSDPFRQGFGLESKAPLGTKQRTVLESISYHEEVKATGASHVSGWEEEPLYSSLTFAPTKFWWMKWDDKPVRNWRPCSPFGVGMMAFCKMIVNIAAIVKKNHPSLPEPTWKWGNECLAVKMPDGKTINKRGDRNEIVTWLRKLWVAAGFNENGYFDYICTNYGKHKNDSDYVAYDIMHDAFRAIREQKSKLEVHGILSVKDCLKFDLDERYVKFSTDGDLNMRAEYSDLGHSPLPDVDLKFDYKRSDPQPKDVNAMMDMYFHRYKDYVQ